LAKDVALVPDAGVDGATDDVADGGTDDVGGADPEGRGDADPVGSGAELLVGVVVRGTNTGLCVAVVDSGRTRK
jgi:hypothetical protein